MQLVMDINTHISLQPCRTNVHSGGLLCIGSIYGAHFCSGPSGPLALLSWSECSILLVELNKASACEVQSWYACQIYP
jgi:hypothetical protein